MAWLSIRLSSEFSSRGTRALGRRSKKTHAMSNTTITAGEGRRRLESRLSSVWSPGL